MAPGLLRRLLPNPVFRQPGPQEDTPFLTARLSRFILLNYEADPALLTPSLPARTELDFHAGRTFVSLLGLHFSNPSIHGLPLPFFREYAQVNLRFYVRRRIERGNWRRGVAFIKQIVPYRPVAWAARNLFHETVVVRSTDQVNRSQGRDTMMTEYGWRSGGQRYFIRAVYPDQPVLPEPSSEEEFLLERYWGYSQQKDGGCLEYRFRRSPLANLQGGGGRGLARGGRFLRPAFAACGSQVTLYRGHPC